MNQQKRILVLGAGGMLGHMAIRVLSKHFTTFGTTRNKKNTNALLFNFLSDDRWIDDVDVLNPESLENTIVFTQPDIVINCVGIIKQKMSASAYLNSLQINSTLPHQLASLSEIHQFKLIQISTDCVFSCKPGVKKQGDEPDARDLYGLTKFLGEVDYGNALTLRTSIVGRQITGDESFFEWILSRRGQQVSGYKNALYTGLTTMSLCELITKVILDHDDLCGLWQVSSESISKYDLIVALNEKLNLGIIIDEDENFFCDRRLDSTPFHEKTGLEVPSWERMLDQFCADQVSY